MAGMVVSWYWRSEWPAVDTTYTERAGLRFVAVLGLPTSVTGIIPAETVAVAAGELAAAAGAEISLVSWGSVRMME